MLVFTLLFVADNAHNAHSGFGNLQEVAQKELLGFQAAGLGVFPLIAKIPMSAMSVVKTKKRSLRMIVFTLFFVADNAHNAYSGFGNLREFAPKGIPEIPGCRFL